MHVKPVTKEKHYLFYNKTIRKQSYIYNYTLKWLTIYLSSTGPQATQDETQVNKPK